MIVGEKEIEGNTVSIRSREDGDVGVKAVDEFVKEILDRIENKK